MALPLATARVRRVGAPRLRDARRAGRVALRTLASLAGITALLATWQLFAWAQWLPLSASSPGDILNELRTEHGVVQGHLSHTVEVALTGYLLAAVVASVLAGATVAVPRLTDSLLRFAVVTYSLPLIALAPVLVVWLGNGAEVRILIAAIAGFFPIMVGCVQGFRAVDAGVDELFEVLAANRWRRFRHLVLPGSMPYVFAGLKISAAAAVIGAIIAEWTGAEEGLGVLMTLAMFAFDPPMVWLSLLTASATSIALYVSIALLERIVVRWKVDRDAIAGGL